MGKGGLILFFVAALVAVQIAKAIVLNASFGSKVF